MKKNKCEVDLNQYKQLILGVLDTAVKDNKFMSTLGSITQQDTANLYSRLYYEDYCVAHNVPYDKMTDDDYINNAYEESLRQYEADLEERE